jgi:hypothetical protein
MIDARFRIESASPREVDLLAYLDRAAEEQANAASLAWIKGLRHARVDDKELRSRFTYRGDSLWWFAELYLHKQQVITQIFRTIGALETLIERERPKALQFLSGTSLARGLAPQVAAACNVRYSGPRGFGRSATVRLAAMDARAATLNAAALASRLRPRSAPVKGHHPTAAAFVHRAFWRSDSGEGSAEAYIGPVLTALEARLDSKDLTYVSLGPASNFRARRWWHPLRGAAAATADNPIEGYAPLAALASSRQLWRERHRLRRALWKSNDLRERSIIRGCDCWPLVREELAGIALLQWPWSARAMDEAAAALDTLCPRVAITYAEAGGWGRALILECRRRGIPTVGLQHGFIYRHWLNYLHEPDEMTPDPTHAADRGFPAPTLTLLFDEYAAKHLTDAGRFAPTTLQVTGSPRLDALVTHVRQLTSSAIDEALASAGYPFTLSSSAKTMVLVTTKYKEAVHALPALVEAAASLLGVHLVIKTHPAETADVYAAVADGRPHVTVVDASAPLAPLLRACRAVVTVNSTVALDAAVLNIPALVIGLPNNLSPFVDAGVMRGCDEGASEVDIARALHRILYDEELRRQLARARDAFLTRFTITADGRAAERAAEAILAMTNGE